MSAIVRSKRLTLNKTAINYWLDLVVFALFISTGITAYLDKSLHETLGIISALVMPAHIGFHWSWITAMISRIRKIKPKQRLKVGLNLLLFGSFLLLILSGLIVAWIWAPAVSEFHTTLFFGFLLLVAAHLALNWKWLQSQTKRRFGTSKRK